MSTVLTIIIILCVKITKVSQEKSDTQRKHSRLAQAALLPGKAKRRADQIPSRRMLYMFVSGFQFSTVMLTISVLFRRGQLAVTRICPASPLVLTQKAVCPPIRLSCPGPISSPAPSTLTSRLSIRKGMTLPI